MKTSLKILNKDQIVFLKEFYPRDNPDWMNTAIITSALRSGAKLPPIIVALRSGQYVLVDGYHRLQAYKAIKQENVQCQVLKGLSDKQIFLEAVQRNTIHGHSLGTKEKAIAINKLSKMGFSSEIISRATNIPVSNLQKFVADRLVSTVSGKVIVKAPLKYMVSGSLERSVKQDLELLQPSISDRSQTQIVDNLFLLVNEGLIDRKDKKLMMKLEALYMVLRTLFSRRKRK